MDDLAHQPQLRIELIAIGAQIAHEIKTERIRRVKADTVNIKFLFPHGNGTKEMFFYSRMA